MSTSDIQNRLAQLSSQISETHILSQRYAKLTENVNTNVASLKQGVQAIEQFFAKQEDPNKLMGSVIKNLSQSITNLENVR
jgi:cell fate (sporulation/competence/biofilm development) regulator YmcA (YheA/YmcA/DUF963 family)